MRRKRSRRPSHWIPNNPQAWYNLGLAQHADNELDDALKSFQQAVKLDPRDVDSYYFEGVCYREMKQFDKAIVVLKQALAIQPLHASSEFALARALQALGDKDAAKEHFKLFQHMTSTKISAAIGLAYGEQGHYSTVTPVEEPQAHQRTMIPMKLVAQPMLDPKARSTANRWRLHAGCDRLGADGPGADGDRENRRFVFCIAEPREALKMSMRRCGSEGSRPCGGLRRGRLRL